MDRGRGREEEKAVEEGLVTEVGIEAWMEVGGIG